MFLWKCCHFASLCKTVLPKVWKNIMSKKISFRVFFSKRTYHLSAGTMPTVPSPSTKTRSVTSSQVEPLLRVSSRGHRKFPSLPVIPLLSSSYSPFAPLTSPQLAKSKFLTYSKSFARSATRFPTKAHFYSRWNVFAQKLVSR